MHLLLNATTYEARPLSGGLSRRDQSPCPEKETASNNGLVAQLPFHRDTRPPIFGPQGDHVGCFFA